jgi:hypothetical protein
MKRALIVFCVVVLSACAQPDYSSTENDVEKPVSNGESQEQVFVPSSPISDFDEAILSSLGLAISGSDSEMAQGIYDWQVKNMKYIPFGSISDMMRWNYMLPGIFTTLDMISINKNTEGKIEGLCYNYATLYCSIAEAYDLECRVTQMKEKPSELDSRIDPKTTTGLGPDEYKRLEAMLASKGYYYSYDLIRSIAKETSAHYRAEVFIDGKWKIYDASVDSIGDGYNQTYEFFEVNWLEGYNKQVIDGFKGTAPDSFIDDLGNKNRASTIDEVRLSGALVPYFNDWSKAAAFLKLPESLLKQFQGEFELYLIFDKMYFEKTGKHFYILCDYIIDDGLEVEEYAELYKELTGEDLELSYFSLLDSFTN